MELATEQRHVLSELNLSEAGTPRRQVASNVEDTEKENLNLKEVSNRSLVITEKASRGSDVHDTCKSQANTSEDIELSQDVDEDGDGDEDADADADAAGDSNVRASFTEPQRTYPCSIITAQNSTIETVEKSHSFKGNERDSSANSTLSEIVASTQQSMIDNAKKNNWSYSNLKKTVKKILPGRKKNEINYNPLDFDEIEGDPGEEKAYEGPTPFHTACYASSSLRRIEKRYSELSLTDRNKLDSKGRTSFDLLLQNKKISQSTLQMNHDYLSDMIVFDEKKLREVAVFALSILDLEKNYLTWDVFTEWIQQVSEEKAEQNIESENKFFSMISKLQRQSKLDGNDIDDDQIKTKIATSRDLQKDDDDVPIQIHFALNLLSAMVDELKEWRDLEKSFTNKGSRSPRKSVDCASPDNKARRKFTRKKKKKSSNDLKLQDSQRKETIHQNPQEYSSKLLASFASIPNLMKTFLLLGNRARTAVFEEDIVRKAMVRKESIEGSWLSEMLQHHHRKRATEYLLLLSELSAAEARNAEQASDENMKQQLKELFQSIGERAEDGLLPSMLAIDNSDVESISDLPMIKKVLDDMITMPFACTLFFFDFVLLGLLIFFFRFCVDSYLQRQDTAIVLRWLYATLFSAFHFQMRAIGRIVSLIAMTRNIFFRSAINIWTILHIFCVFMVIWSIIIIRYSAPRGKDEYLLDDAVRGQFAATTLLLWINLLSLIKSMNVKLATFVSAVVQIVRDVLWYVILIMGMVLCFSQVFYTLLIPSDCVDHAGIKDCKAAEYYLLVYSVLLGELDEELIGGIENKRFALFLFICFTFIMAIVMLNILIAVISESYEKTILKSTKLFGRCRVTQLAEILALQDLFRVRDDNRFTHYFFRWTPFEWTKGGFAFFIITACMYMFWAIIDISAEVRIAEKGSTLWLLSVLVFILNLVMMMIFLFLLARAAQKSDNKVKIQNYFINSIYKWIQWLMARLLGKSNDTLLQDQWDGRLMYIKKEISTSTKNLSDAIHIVQTDLRKMTEFRKDFDDKMKHMQEQMNRLLEEKMVAIEMEDSPRRQSRM